MSSQASEASQALAASQSLAGTQALAASQKKIYDTLKHIIIGCCVDISTEKHYNRLKNMLDNNNIKLTTQEIDDLCKIYRNTIHEIHGFYPIQDCNVMLLLKSAAATTDTTFANGMC